MSRYIVGLTGGIGSGKTAASDAFAKLGIDIVDADIIAREVVEPGTSAYQAIVNKFGQQVLQPDKQLDRGKLRELIFAEPANKNWLNKQLHPQIRKQMNIQCQMAKSPYCVLAIPLLVENHLQELVDEVLVVDVDEQTQINRAMSRDNNSAEQIKAIMAAQASREERLAAADKVIDNNGDPADLTSQIELLHQDYLEKVQLLSNG